MNGVAADACRSIAIAKPGESAPPEWIEIENGVKFSKGTDPNESESRRDVRQAHLIASIVGLAFGLGSMNRANC